MGEAMFRFPCGMDIEIKSSPESGAKNIGEGGLLDWIIEHGCPLHGKYCKLEI